MRSRPERATRRPERVLFFLFSPSGVLAVALVFVAGWIVVLIFTVGQAIVDRSQETQGHGALRSATVISVQNFAKDDPGGNPYDTNTSNAGQGRVLVELAAPVGGQQQTTVNVPYQVGYNQGDKISVLVNPQQPGYAELPGVPEKTATGQTVLTVVFSALLALSVTGTFFAARWRLRSRRRGSVPGRPGILPR